jgi:malonyl-CoA O-methyltransferase
VLGVDLSETMLVCRDTNARGPVAAETLVIPAQAGIHSAQFLCANTLSLPLTSQSVDLIFANLLFPWQANLAGQLKEFYRVLRPEGLLVFTLLGLDTARELQQHLPIEDLPPLIDMHDIGDQLLKKYFADPIVDVSYYTLNYRDKEKLISEQRAAGMVSESADLSKLKPNEQNIYELTYEVIHAHAWRPAVDKQTTLSDGTVKIPLSSLRKR